MPNFRYPSLYISSRTFKCVYNLSFPPQEPISKTQLQINSTVAGSSIELSCKVLVGKVQAIDWKKDGKPLPRNRCYWLSENFSLLYIPEAQKSDCGSFSCNASSDINWQETSVNLTIEGKCCISIFDCKHLPWLVPNLMLSGATCYPLQVAD